MSTPPMATSCPPCSSREPCDVTDGQLAVPPPPPPTPSLGTWPGSALTFPPARTALN